MQYIEVATLRAKILHQIRTCEAVDVIEQTLREYSDAVWHNGRAHAHNNEGAVDLSDGIVLHKPGPEYNRAELIQLTAGALSGALSGTGRHIRPEQIAEYAVGCAEAALDIINKK